MGLVPEEVQFSGTLLLLLLLLLFLLLFNTFIQTLTKSKEFDQLNYRYDNIIQPRNWFQFADDAAAVTSSE